MDLTEIILRLVQSARPDVVFRAADGAIILVQAKRKPVTVPVEQLLWSAPTAPVSAWVGAEGLERGLGLSLLASIRALIPGAAPLTPKPGHCPDWASSARMTTALALIGHAVVTQASGTRGPAGVDALARVMHIFGLDQTETARLFGVARQALDHWRRHGVPAERQAKLTTMLAIGELLQRNLRPGVVPGVARTPAVAYGGRPMLERIAANEHDSLLDDVRTSFDWAASA
ncbi:MAG TPA: hypothetical protein VFV05_25535 [Methylomirabilota bacterium]|nr:hypothetical protein [Methylomirabilota bacterium]